MIVGVPKETFPDERRVALVPDVLPALTKAGLEVLIETDAGAAAGFGDPAYTARGGRIASSRQEVFSAATLIAQVRAAGANPQAGAADVSLLRPEHVLIAMCDPLSEPAAVQALAGRGVRVFALELIPRTTRAQSMDVLSSMATIAGYKSVILAASHLPRIFPMLMTAAGTVAPAHVLVIGAGVAGLQAIASAKRLGAVVPAYDVRPAVKEQCESLGAKFVQMGLETKDTEAAGGYARTMDEGFYRRQRELMKQVVAANHVVITTAAVPGAKAPVLITADMVDGMMPGSVIVDLAAERGGNCELTRPGEKVTRGGVTILGPLNLASTVPTHASQMFARNMTAFVRLLVKDKALNIDMNDDIIRDTLLTQNGQVVHPQVRERLEAAPAPAPGASTQEAQEGGVD